MVSELAEELKPPEPTVIEVEGGFKKSNLNPSSGSRVILVTSVVDSHLHRCYKAFQDHGGNTAVYNIGAGTASESGRWCEEYDDNC